MIIAAIVSILVGVLILGYNLMSVLTHRSGAHDEMDDIDMAIFKRIYYTFIISTSVLFVALIFSGIALMLELNNSKHIAAMSFMSPVFYMIILVVFGKFTKWKREMGTAMGIGNGGLFFVIVSGLPLWGPFVVCF